MKLTEILSGPLKPREGYITHTPRVIRLGDIKTLLIGIEEDGVVLKDFKFKKITPALKIEIGDVEAMDELDQYPGKKIVYRLATSLESCCGTSFTNMKIEQRVLILNKLAVEDIAFLTLYQEFLECEGEIDGVFRGKTCRGCLKPLEGTPADVNGMECKAFDWSPGEPPRAVMVLKNRFKYYGNEVAALILRPPRWGGTFYGLEVNQWGNQTRTETLIIADSIEGMIYSDGFDRGDMNIDLVAVEYADLCRVLDSEKERQKMYEIASKISAGSDYVLKIKHQCNSHVTTEHTVMYDVRRQSFFFRAGTE